MTDLISRLSELRCQYNCFDEHERDAYHTLSEAIKAISDVGGTISRQVAMDALSKMYKQPTSTEDFMTVGYDRGIADAVVTLHTLPTASEAIKAISAQPERRGEWIKNDNGTYSCNQCHSWIPNEQHYYARYCIFCGARMEEQDERA